MTKIILLLTLLPIAAFLIICFLTKKAKKESAIIALVSVAASFIFSLKILVEKVMNPDVVEKSVEWLNIPTIGGVRGLQIEMGYLIDPLSAVMLVIVSFVAMLVILYSFGYMKDDEGYSRLFCIFIFIYFLNAGISYFK